MSLSIERITRDNYYMFDDMVYWRTNRVERTQEEKQITRNRSFKAACLELEHSDFLVYAAVYEGRFVGWISLIYTPKIGQWSGGVVYIDELWVAPEFRRRGIAMVLMAQAFTYQQKTGAVEVRLYAEENNIAAQNLYRKCGLQCSGRAVFMTSCQGCGNDTV